MSGMTDIETAREALDSMDDFARMNVGVDAHGPRGVLKRLIEDYERLRGLIAEIDPQRKPATGEMRHVANELRSIAALAQDLATNKGT